MLRAFLMITEFANLTPVLPGVAQWGITRQDVTNFLDLHPEVLNWFTFTSGSLVIVSNHDVKYIANLIRQRFPGLNFLLTEIHGQTSDGYLPKEIWDSINAPKPSGKWG